MYKVQKNKTNNSILYLISNEKDEKLFSLEIIKKHY